MKIKGQGHSLTLIEGHSDSNVSNFFSLETARLIEAKFDVEPPCDGRMKVNTNELCHMTKMAATFIYVKNFLKNLILCNQKADDLETWYARVLPSIFK